MAKAATAVAGLDKTIKQIPVVPEDAGCSASREQHQHLWAKLLFFYHITSLVAREV
jgi:hypothetical protein